MKRFASRAKRNSGVPSAVCRTLAVACHPACSEQQRSKRALPAHLSTIEGNRREGTQGVAIVQRRPSSDSGRLHRCREIVPWISFRRGYYQCTAQVSAAPSGGSIVRVSATISAWYTDPISGKSGYQTLPSNGRLEADFLDRLQDVLSSHGSSSNTTLGTTASNPSASAARSQPNPPQAAPSAPQPSAPGVGSKTPVGSPFKLGSSTEFG